LGKDVVEGAEEQRKRKEKRKRNSEARVSEDDVG
jgi:hypothetical protein